MTYILELKTIQELAKIFEETDENSIYRFDAIRLIKKWKYEVELKKDKETDFLLNQLLEKYSNYYLSN